LGAAYQLYGQLAASVTPGVPLPGRQQLLGAWTAAVQALTANQGELLSWQEGCAALMQQLHQQLTSAAALDTDGPLRVSHSDWCHRCDIDRLVCQQHAWWSSAGFCAHPHSNCHQRLSLTPVMLLN
jgi:hypothetical protein